MLAKEVDWVLHKGKESMHVSQSKHACAGGGGKGYSIKPGKKNVSQSRNH